MLPEEEMLMQSVYGTRIVAPKSMREETLQKMHHRFRNFSYECSIRVFQ